MQQYLQNNKNLWNEWTKINVASTLYRLEQFKQGENKLNSLEREEVGNVQGRSLLHLQCHFGMDSLSWARLGAEVTAVDFSTESISLARALSEEMNIPARFICCNLYDLPRFVENSFDIVYTSYGVLSWLPDLSEWARLVARYIKPGGFFYMAEFHPFAMMFDETADEMKLRYSYFGHQVIQSEVEGSYADRTARMETKVMYEWPHSLAEVVSSLCREGLSIEYLHEFPFTVYHQLPCLEQQDEHIWVQPEGMPKIPLLFSIKANKNH